MLASLVSPYALHRDYTVPPPTVFPFYTMVIAKSWTTIHLHVANNSLYAQYEKICLLLPKIKVVDVTSNTLTVNIWSGKIHWF